MTARKPKVYKLADALREALEKADPIRLESDDGTVFVIPNAVEWPDDVFTSDDITAAKMLLGDQYDAWSAASFTVGDKTYHGTARLLFKAIGYVNGLSVPE